jgi:hypothetical protein
MKLFEIFALDQSTFTPKVPATCSLIDMEMKYMYTVQVLDHMLTL